MPRQYNKLVLPSTLEEIGENALLFFQNEEKLKNVLIKFHAGSCVKKFVLDNFIKFEKLMY